MASVKKYADLADINYFDWANSLTTQDPFHGVDIDGFVASLMKAAPATKSEKYAAYAPAFSARLQEPEYVLPAAPAAPVESITQPAPEDADEFNPFLSCGTCFVPVLDLSPDEHGVTVNTYGSTGVVAARATPEGPNVAAIQPVLLKPVADPESEPVPFQFRQLVDCPTCFVPSSDLSPDEHGTMVNTGATRTVAVLQTGIPEPEFLPYEPLDDEFLPGTPRASVEDGELPWDAVETCGDNTDPFAALWDHSTLFQSAFEVNAPLDTVATGLGKRTVESVANQQPMQVPVGNDAWPQSLFPELECEAQPLKKKKAMPVMAPVIVAATHQQRTPAPSGLPISSPDADAGLGFDGMDMAPLATRNLCPRATRILKEWMTSAEHFDHPYPDEKEKLELAAKAGITTKQLTIWFTNARKRLWAPMRKRQGLPIIGFAEYRTEQKKKVAETQQRASGKPACSGPRGTVPVTQTATPNPSPAQQHVMMHTPAGVTKVKLMLPTVQRKPAQQFVVGKVTFDTGVEPMSIVLAKMEVMSKSLAADKRELSVRLQHIEQQERSLRAAMEALRT